MKNISYQPSLQSAATTTAQSSSSKKTRNSKLDHIVQNFYTKTAQLIIQARSITPDGNQHYFDTHRQDLKKLNKWFNVSTEDIGSLRDELKHWRTRVTQAVDHEPPPMIIDIYLDTSRLTQKQTLVVMDDALKRNKVNLVPSLTDTTFGVKRIVIESWVLTLNRPLPDHPVDLPNLYKRSIIFFRSLYSLVRLLPSHNLYRQLYNLNDTRDISIGYQFSARIIQRHDEIPLESPILAQDTTKLTKTCLLNDITTPLGTFKLRVDYRRNCDFRVEDPDNPVSARYVDMDERFFTPTMETNQPNYRPFPTRTRPYSMYDTRGSILADMAQGKDFQNIIPKSSFSTGYNRNLNLAVKSSKVTTHPRYCNLTPPNRDLTPLIISPESSTPIPRPLSSPSVSPFKSPSLSSSPQAENLVSGFKTASRTDPPKSMDSSQASSSGSLGRKIEFSSSFEKYKTSPSRTDSGGALGKWTRHYNTIDKLSDPNLEEFIRLVGGTNDLKLFQYQSPPPPPPPPPPPLFDSILLNENDPGSNHRSKRTLSHYETMRHVHNSLSENVHSSMKGLESRDDLLPRPSTSTGRAHQPTRPSPLHTEQRPISPRQSVTVYPRTQQRWYSSTENPSPHDDRSDQRRFVDEDSEEEDGQPGVGRSSPGADDDDSLVFNMSELAGGGGGGGEIDSALSPPILFNRAQRLADATIH